MERTCFTRRREALRPLLHAKKLEALLVSLDANRFYLSGFELQDHQVNESAGCLVVQSDGDDWLCTDARYDVAAKRLWDHDRIFIYSGDAATQIGAFFRDKIQGNLGFDPRVLSFASHTSLSGHLRLAPAEGLVESLRMVKEPEEIACLERAVSLNHRLMEWLPSILGADRTEYELAWAIERFFRDHGASSLAFPCIAAAGPNAALPHATPGDSRIREKACVLVDTGCRVDTYCSDQTRTFWIGDTPSRQFLRALDAVRVAQEKAIAFIRPGVAAKDVYFVARNYFERKKCTAHFTHSLGHGIGLQTHEGPSLSPRSEEILRAGMVLTVEPGLYYPQWGGVRWEHMVLVTEEGARVL